MDSSVRKCEAGAEAWILFYSITCAYGQKYSRWRYRREPCLKKSAIQSPDVSRQGDLIEFFLDLPAAADLNVIGGYRCA